MSSQNPYLMENPRRDHFYRDISQKIVTIIGLGGGAEIAFRMLQSGVVKMHLFDFDTLDSANLIRHICGTPYVGKNKAVATKELLDSYAGFSAEESTIFAHTQNIMESPEEFQKALTESNLLICATDTEASRFYIGEAATDRGIDAIFVSMFEGGMGGEVILTTPKGPCYECAMRHQGHKEFVRRYNNVVKKGDCTSHRDASAMPGLGIDQSFLCSIASRKALESLLSDQEHSLVPISGSWIVFSLFGIPNILETQLSSLVFDLPKHAECSCNQDA